MNHIPGVDDMDWLKVLKSKCRLLWNGYNQLSEEPRPSNENENNRLKVLVAAATYVTCCALALACWSTAVEVIRPLVVAICLCVLEPYQMTFDKI